MAITDAEKQEIIDELLAEIRANGLDYSGQTITFPDAFNITQTERQNVKIPAIDERSSTPVHGNVDLEALLTAYGVTHVEEIASDISSKYMKKVADSDLNMNGNDINGLVSIACKSIGNAPSTNTYFVPKYHYSALGLTTSDSLATFMTKWIETVFQEYQGSVGTYIGTVQPSVAGVVIFYLYSSTLNTDTGLPNYCTGLFYSYSDSHFVRFYTSQGILYMNKVSDFPYGDTTRDNRINASGVSEDGSSYYIRWENGFQICFGSFTRNVSVSSANGNVYTRSVYVDHLYPVTFTSVVHLSVTPSYNNIGGVYHNLWVGFNYTYTSKIQYIGISSPTPINNTDLKFDFIAIGKWR